MKTLWDPIKETISVLLDQGLGADLDLRDATQAELVTLLNVQRAQMGNPAQVYGPGLSSQLRQAAKGHHLPILDEISEALGLHQFGLDASLWFRPIPEIKNLIRAALKGGVFATINEMVLDETLFSLSGKIKLGLADLAGAHTPVFDFPETRIPVGHDVALRLNMPFDGYVRVLASERGNFFCLNDRLGLETTKIKEGTMDLPELETSSHVSRTTFMVLAATEDAFDVWPEHLDTTSPMKDGELLSLLENFVNLPNSKTSASVRAMVNHA